MLFIGRPVINTEQLLVDAEEVSGIANALSGAEAERNARRRRLVAGEPAGIERTGTVGESIGGLRAIRFELGVADQNTLAQQRPIALSDISTRIAAAGHKGQAALLDVGNSTVLHQEPPGAQPDCGKILLRPIEGAGVAVNGGDGTVRLRRAKGRAGRVASRDSGVTAAVLSRAQRGIAQTGDIGIVIVVSRPSLCGSVGVVHRQQRTAVGYVAYPGARRSLADIQQRCHSG